jgi:protein kinase A
MTMAIKREKKMLCLLEHPFIVHLVGSYQDDENLYLLLPLIPGGELYNLLQKECVFSNKTSAFYGACIVEALGYFHQRHIAYRDLKLENVMIDESGKIICFFFFFFNGKTQISSNFLLRPSGYTKIVDLGFAKIVSDGKTYTLCGTPEYLAPEIILSKGHNWAVEYVADEEFRDHKRNCNLHSHISTELLYPNYSYWSFGVLLYEFLVGHTPFYLRGSSQIDLFKRIVLVQYQLPASTSDSGRDLIQKLLVRQPRRRLGNLASGYLDVKRHPWFKDSGIDFKKLVRKETKAPWKPAIHNALAALCVDDLNSHSTKASRRLRKSEQELFRDF